MKSFIKKSIVVLVVVGILGGVTFWYLGRSNGDTPDFRTAKVTRGDLVVSIGATGTVEPEEVIDVGAQVAGQILSFGTDVNGKTVDYGSVVDEGTVLARIDDSLYLADEAQTKAQVQSAKAGILSAQANLEQMKAKFRQAERDWRRAQNLGPSEALAQASYDAYQSAYETAKANVAVGEAAILQAKASLAQAKAVLLRAERNLGYCTIRSPVKGVIIDRRVNIGQTVVSSLNAPSLFLIAKDLRRMQVWVAVNEADIGKIKPGQPVTFTVDAFPGETFEGKVGKVRLNASMTQNVVTYTVVVITDNSTGRLLPYLTANVAFELHHAKGVLMVPNTALRWMPSAEQVAPEFQKAIESRAAGKQRLHGGRPPVSTSGQALPAGWKRRVLWVEQGIHVRPLRVLAGESNGSMTEVRGQGLTQGMEVVTGLETVARDQTGARNPFVPQFRRHNQAGRQSR